MRSSIQLFKALKAPKPHRRFLTDTKETPPPVSENAPNPTYEENLERMRKRIEQIKPGDYTVLDSSGLKEAYDDAVRRSYPSAY